jgi:predicted DCC family thiol-disulfide oxidoreductase YuxK
MRPLALYDPDCGFCARWIGLVRRHVPGVAVAPLTAVDLAALRVDGVRAEQEMPLIRPDGGVVYGHEAWAGILLAGPAPARWAGALLGSRALRRPAAATYAWIARHRHRLPGGTPACSLDS